MKHFLLNYFNFKINKINSRDLPGGLVSMAPRSPMQWDRVRSLIWELDCTCGNDLSCHNKEPVQTNKQIQLKIKINKSYKCQY